VQSSFIQPAKRLWRFSQVECCSIASAMIILPADLRHPDVLSLLAVHLAGMNAHSPAGHVHALDLSGLDRPDITFVAAWEEDQLLGFGAMKELDPEQGEIKSMRTAMAHLRKGVAAAILDHLLDLARTRGYGRVSLETGSGEAFEPALTLYRARGFTKGTAFGDYQSSDWNQFFHLDL
jgi:putative acetyltransferase